MFHDVDAIYDNGAFHPLQPLRLPDGVRVHLRVEQQEKETADTSAQHGDYEAWLDGLPGRWHGDFARGSEGEFEPRESLS